MQLVFESTRAPYIPMLLALDIAGCYERHNLLYKKRKMVLKYPIADVESIFLKQKLRSEGRGEGWGYYRFDYRGRICFL
jgi:hypothetical protein